VSIIAAACETVTEPCLPAAAATGAPPQSRRARVQKRSSAENKAILSVLDEDGVRVVWDSRPSPQVAAARSRWRSLKPEDMLQWTQTSSDVQVTIALPEGQHKHTKTTIAESQTSAGEDHVNAH
jgi:hypothetical protein